MAKSTKANQSKPLIKSTRRQNELEKPKPKPRPRTWKPGAELIEQIQ